MKVADLTALPTNGLWHVYFQVGSTTYFTSVFNNPVSGLQYEYGHVGTGSDTTDGDADGGSISVADKTITVVVANSKVGNPTTGTTLSGIYGRTITLVGGQVPGVVAEFVALGLFRQQPGLPAFAEDDGALSWVHVSLAGQVHWTQAPAEEEEQFVDRVGAQ